MTDDCEDDLDLILELCAELDVPTNAIPENNMCPHQIVRDVETVDVMSDALSETYDELCRDWCFYCEELSTSMKNVPIPHQVIHATPRVETPRPAKMSKKMY